MGVRSDGACPHPTSDLLVKKKEKNLELELAPGYYLFID
jgi:hypothetical protein